MSNKEQLLTTWVDCPDCNGDGFHEVGPQCFKPASDCCGGCYIHEDCKGCESGEVSLTINDDGMAQLIEAMRNED